MADASRVFWEMSKIMKDFASIFRVCDRVAIALLRWRAQATRSSRLCTNELTNAGQTYSYPSFLQEPPFPA
jgi:hypothetical protein